jgi:peroxiredoxin
MRVKALALMILAGICAFPLSGAARADSLIGQDAPAFVATTLDGKVFDLSALKGKVVIVNFWATWCPSCREEMPELEALWRRYRNQGLEVLAVSADSRHARGAVDQVMRYFSFPAAVMDAITKNDLVTLSAVPLTFLIDKSGKVADIRVPPLKPLTEFELGNKIKALLEAKEEPKPEAKQETKSETKNDEKK